MKNRSRYDGESEDGEETAHFTKRNQATNTHE
jgi:hypothetical protein